MLPVLTTLSPSSVQPEKPSRRLRWATFASGVLMWLLIAVWGMFGIVWLVLHGWIVPRIGEWRPQLESVASHALGVPVRIASITARSTGVIPSFELQGVTLLGPQGQAAVSLPRVLATLSPRSLLGLGFEQLVIDQPELDIRRELVRGYEALGGLGSAVSVFGSARTPTDHPDHGTHGPTA